MRGPNDDETNGDRVSPTATDSPVSDAELSPVSIGGKPLARLVELLESCGYSDIAAAAMVQAAGATSGVADITERVVAAAALGLSAEGGFGAVKAVLDAGAVQAEAAATRRMEASTSLPPPTDTRPRWRSLGPTTIPNGQTYGAKRVGVSGRVAAIAIDPRDPSRLLVGSANGGVWQSLDRGATWTPRTDFQSSLAVGALAIDPEVPSTVYCGTGEGNSFWFLGQGVLRSKDGGATWESLCTEPFTGHGFFDLLVDPANSQHLLAGTTIGLFASVDGGVTWTRIRDKVTWSLSTGKTSDGAYEILAGCSDGLQRSTDGGITWHAETLPEQPEPLPDQPNVFIRLAVSIAPSNSSVAYAWGAAGEVVESVTGDKIKAVVGYLWRREKGIWSLEQLPPDVALKQANYDWFVAVSPDNDAQVYLGAIDLHRGDRSGTAFQWLRLSTRGPSGDSIHPDQHVIAFERERPSTIYVGNDGGLFRSENRGITWESLNHGLVISEFEYLAQDCGASRWLLGGTQDNGTLRWQGSSIWEQVDNGDGGDCGVNRDDPSIVFHTHYNMSPRRSNAGGSYGSWTPIAPPVPPGEQSAFYPPFECSATGGNTIAIGGDAVYVSRSNGNSWTRLAFPRVARTSAMYIPNADSLYLGTKPVSKVKDAPGGGFLFRSQWDGSAWSALTYLTVPWKNAAINDLFVDPTDTRRIWVAEAKDVEGRVFRSDDGGTTWSDRSAGLEKLPIRSIEVDPTDRNRVWVGTNVGVWESRDGGETWADFSNGLPRAVIGDLLFHPHARVLRAGTRNRGVWEIPVDGWMSEPRCGVQWTAQLGAHEQHRWTSYGWPATWHVVWTIMPMPTGVKVGAPQVSWTVQVERADAEYVTYWIAVRNLTNAPLSFEGRYAILSLY